MLSRAFDLLAKLIGRAAAQVVCFILVWSIIGLCVRLYGLIDSMVPGGIDPVPAVMLGFIAFVAFASWRLIRDAKLDD